MSITMYFCTHYLLAAWLSEAAVHEQLGSHFTASLAHYLISSLMLALALRLVHDGFVCLFVWRHAGCRGSSNPSGMPRTRLPRAICWSRSAAWHACLCPESSSPHHTSRHPPSLAASWHDVCQLLSSGTTSTRALHCCSWPDMAWHCSWLGAPGHASTRSILSAGSHRRPAATA
jgi:hypothetical protein